jgi:3-hydroxyacyl-[acyl-carrier-protein] dehydratase
MAVRFHLVDRIDHHEPGRSVRARKLTSSAETFWEGGPGAEPAMPGPLVLESLCQAATWLIVAGSGGRRRAALLQIGSVSFLGEVRPGDVLELAGEVTSMSEEMAVLAGTAAVDGRTVLEAADVMCALIDAGELADPDETARMREQLTRGERP